jgi:hypothetical protein
MSDETVNKARSEKEMSAYEIARQISTIEMFAKVFDDYLNLGGKQLSAGLVVGAELRKTHRTLQRQAIAFCLGVIMSLSAQEYTDPRNAQAIETAKKIKVLYDNGELDLGPYI